MTEKDLYHQMKDWEVMAVGFRLPGDSDSMVELWWKKIRARGHFIVEDLEKASDYILNLGKRPSLPGLIRGLEEARGERHEVEAQEEKLKEREEWARIWKDGTGEKGSRDFFDGLRICLEEADQERREKKFLTFCDHMGRIRPDLKAGFEKTRQSLASYYERRREDGKR